MLAMELYTSLNNDGVQLWAEGEKLRFAPKEKITPFLLAELKANKSELLLLLAANESYSPLEDGQQQPPFSLNNYSHCVTCNQIGRAHV